MGAPQIILLTIMALLIGARLTGVIDGELTPKAFIFSIIGDIAFVGLLIWGGFFR